jgi:hypothetical protein
LENEIRIDDMVMDNTATAAITEIVIGAINPAFTPTSKTIKENSEIWDRFREVWKKVCFRKPNLLSRNI